MTPGSIGQNGRVQHLTAACAFPGIKRPHVVIKLLVEHATLALRTFHD